MKLIKSVFVAGASLAVVAAANAGDYNSFSSFTGALKAGYDNETFSTWTEGNPLDGVTTGATYNDSGNANFNFSILGGNGVAGTNNLYSIPTAVSTYNDNVSLTYSFANSPTAVTAFGGDFYGTDLNGYSSGATVTLTFFSAASSTNPIYTEVLNGTTGTGFYGYTSAVALASVTETVTNNPNLTQFTTATNLVIGAQPAPEPFTMGLVGLSVLAVVRKRRSSR